MHNHTVKAYDRDLDALDRLVAEMGGIAAKIVVDAVDALASGDTAYAREVVAADARLDALQREIESVAVLTIARRAPMAVDLREIIGAIRVAGDLERVGDLAKSIAKRAIKLGPQSKVSRAVIGLKHMSAVASDLLKDVLDAYAQRDAELAGKVWRGDVDLDSLEDSMFRELLTLMMEDPRAISSSAQLLFCSKHIERIGDHATNIAENIVYLVTGQPISSERPRGAREPDADLETGRGPE